MIKTLLTLCVTVLLGTGLTFGQGTTYTRSDLSQADIDRIVAKFTQNERRFREALNIYAFNRNASISTIGMGGQITGTYRRESFMTFDQGGRRMEKILFAPISTLTEITVTQDDIENLGGLDPFAIEPAHVDKYKFTYLGKEKIDELNLHVFDVAPKVLPKAERGGLKLFLGRIWVDDQDLLIVKSKGKAVPETKNDKFAVIETWRENIDGKYWFPSFSTSDDELVFDNGHAVKMKIRVKYSNYGVGRTDVKAIGDDDGAVEPEAKPSPTPSPAGGKKP
ncbi:MAG TPA: hypothetical protein VNA22_07235 [Pyrinomonadaceae bacterium]|nr:hypothetical protein [Pyrinomonadaceae bacterium]